MKLCVTLFWPSKIMFSVVFDAKYGSGLAKIVFLMIKNLVLKFWVENSCFWKTFKLILMHFILEIPWFEYFLHNLLQFFKKFSFPEFRLIECDFQSVENWKFLKANSRPCLIAIWLVFDQLNMIYSYFDRLKLIFDRSKNLKGNFKELSALLNRYPIGTRSIEECFKRKIKSFSEHVFFNFSFFLSLFLFSLSIDPAKIFLSFLSQIFKGFSSSSLGKTL